MKFRITASYTSKTLGRKRHAVNVEAEDIGEAMDVLGEDDFAGMKLSDDHDKKDIIELNVSVKRIAL